jgi:RecB family endonuclease NucS
MSDIKLFKLANNNVLELTGKSAKLEKDLQAHIEQNMDVLLGVRYLASEYGTGKTHKGRIDSLGLDENGCPVIVEYKRHSNEKCDKPRIILPRLVTRPPSGIPLAGNGENRQRRRRRH